MSPPEKRNGKRVKISGENKEKSTVIPRKDFRSYADSAATGHSFHSKLLFVPGSLRKCYQTTILLADKMSVTANKCGEVIFPFENANISLKNFFHIPGMGYYLVFTGVIADNGMESYFSRNFVNLEPEATGLNIGKGCRDA